MLAGFGPGCHELATDGDRTRRLLFFAAGPGPELRWTAESPLRRERGGPELTGACGLDVADPALFFETFVAGGGVMDPAFVLVLVDRLVQGVVDHRAATAPAAPDPIDLDGDLAACGLACRRLALQAATASAATVSAATVSAAPVVRESWRPVRS